MLVLKRIHVTYRLALDPEADRDTVDRVMQLHPERCPVYRSIHPQVFITTALELLVA